MRKVGASSSRKEKKYWRQNKIYDLHHHIVW